MPRGLDFKTALVTGGNLGIGREIALALAGARAKVSICGGIVETPAAADLLSRRTPGAFWKVADVRSEKEQRAIFREIREGWETASTSAFPAPGRPRSPLLRDDDRRLAPRHGDQPHGLHLT